MCVPGSKRNLAFLDYMFAMFSFAVRSIFVKESDYYPELKDERKRFGSVKMAETLFGILVSLVLAAVVLPLLSSANPIFKNIISNIFKSSTIKITMIKTEATGRAALTGNPADVYLDNALVLAYSIQNSARVTIEDSNNLTISASDSIDPSHRLALGALSHFNINKNNQIFIYT